MAAATHQASSIPEKKIRRGVNMEDRQLFKGSHFPLRFSTLSSSSRGWAASPGPWLSLSGSFLLLSAGMGGGVGSLFLLQDWSS